MLAVTVHFEVPTASSGLFLLRSVTLKWALFPVFLQNKNCLCFLFFLCLHILFIYFFY